MADRILITGAAGFIGMHCAANALKKGREIVGIDNFNDFTYPAFIKYERIRALKLDDVTLLSDQKHVSIPGLDFHVVDCVDAATVRSMIVDGGFDVILHLAGMTSVSASSLSPDVFFDNNLRGFLNVLEGIRALPRDQRPRLVFASSAAVYGNHDRALVEDDLNLLKPESIYGSSKCMMECVASTYARLYGIRSLALRLFNIYGPYERPDTLISDVIRALLTGTPMELYDDGSCARDYMYIDDCVKAIAKACDVFLPDGTDYDVVNIGTGEAVSATEIINTLEKITSTELSFISEQRPGGEIKSLKADPAKFKRIFGINPEVKLEQGLKACVDHVLHMQKEYFK